MLLQLQMQIAMSLIIYFRKQNLAKNRQKALNKKELKTKDLIKQEILENILVIQSIWFLGKEKNNLFRIKISLTNPIHLSSYKESIITQSQQIFKIDEIYLLFLIIKQTIYLMRGQSYDNTRNEQYQSRKTNSHFVSLQCVLDKYQHQNYMLAQKVASLIQQNKRLKQTKPINDYLNTSTRRIQQKNLCREENGGKNSQVFSQINKKVQRSYNYSLPKKSNTYINKGNLTIPRERSIQLFQPLDYRRQSKKKQNQNEIKTERKYSYLQKQLQKSQKDVQSITNYTQLKYPYPKNCTQIKYSTSIQSKSLQKNKNDMRNYLQNNSPRNIQAYNGRERAKTEISQGNLQRSQPLRNNFNKNVYLQKQTFLQQGYQQKIPSFIQASFGYKQPKELGQNILQIKSKLSPVNVNTTYLSTLNKSKEKIQAKLSISDKKIKHDTIVKCFKLGKRQQENKQNIEVKIQKIEKLQPLYIEQKQKFEARISRKNNSPYINPDYKLTQPKTQLSKIYLPEKAKIKQKQEKIDVKPVVLEQNRFMFEINESTQNSQDKKQLILKQPKQFSLTIESNQRATDNTDHRERKSSIWGKKKFINVMSRPPKKSIFLK